MLVQAVGLDAAVEGAQGDAQGGGGGGAIALMLGKGAAKLSPKAETACEESAASDPAALPEDSDSAEQ